MQAVSFSCSAGRVVVREVPFRNAGNIPLRVRLKVAGEQAGLFAITPDFLLMEPGEVGTGLHVQHCTCTLGVRERVC